MAEGWKVALASGLAAFCILQFRAPLCMCDPTSVALLRGDPISWSCQFPSIADLDVVLFPVGGGGAALRHVVCFTDISRQPASEVCPEPFYLGLVTSRCS